MDKGITYIGLDVHKDTIAVAFVTDGRGEVCALRQISSTPAALTRLSSKRARNGWVLRFGYEAVAARLRHSTAIGCCRA